MKVLFTALVMLYLVLDVTHPGLPGAVSVDPEDSVEVVRLQRTPSAMPRTLAALPEPGVPLPRVSRADFHNGRVPRGPFTPAPLHVIRRLPPDASASDEG